MPATPVPSPADLAGATRAGSIAGGIQVSEPAAPVSSAPPAHGAGARGALVTGAQCLVMALEALGVDTVFGIPGGAILPAYDPLLDSTTVRHILVRHEQGAGHAAEG
jgi:acetolactate synthase-1/2/3 large subunit